MQAQTVRDLGAAVRSKRRTLGLTQADLARRLGVGREWVVRLERGHPRLEAQKVLDALVVLGLGLTLTETELPPRTKAMMSGRGAERVAMSEKGAPASDPFEAIFSKRRR